LVFTANVKIIIIMTNINININFGNLGEWINILVHRISIITPNDIAYIIIALIFPPIAVLLKVGFTAHFWINIILTLIGYVPGQLHALWVVLFM
jgi:uncharacterized membrane protein YqaE (UPF0057 family)